MGNLGQMIVVRLKRFTGMNRVDNAITRNSKQLAALGRRLCDHEKWEYDGPAKRKCKTCGKEQWLFYDRFPRIDAPALEWRDWDRNPEKALP